MLCSFATANFIWRVPTRMVCLALMAVAVMLSHPAQAAETSPIDLKANGFSQDLAGAVRYYVDEVNELTPETALASRTSERFRPISTALVDFGFIRSKIWLHAAVRNDTATPGRWTLALDVPNVESLVVYQADRTPGRPPQLRKLLQVDDTMAFARRSMNYRNLAATIALPADTVADILVAYSSKQATQLPLSIESEDHFYARVRHEDLHNWAMLAMLIGMTLVSTVYLMAMGFGTAGYYGAYILISGLYLFHTDGYAFQYLWPDAPRWNSIAVAPIGMAMVAAGCLFARSFISAPKYHPRLNTLLLACIAIATVLLVVSIFGLESRWFKTGTLLFVVATSILYLTSGILAARRGQAGAVFFVIGSLAIISTICFGAAGYLFPGQFNQDVAGHYGRYALLGEGTAFSFAILLHILNLRRERDRALQREVQTAQEKLAVSEALIEAQKSHSRAVALAESRRHRLASTAHDIQQPLASLRMAVTQLTDRDDKTVERVHSSFDYLDRIVQTNLDDTRPREDVVGHDHHEAPTGDPFEAFPVSVVLDNIAAMFGEEARNKGLDLRVIPSGAVVNTAPLALMRIVSNLVSNAIKYTEDGRVLLGCRRRNGHLCIEIHDTGPGMSESELARLAEPYERASDAPGTGLGLALVHELAATANLDLHLASAPGKGTRAIVCAKRVT